MKSLRKIFQEALEEADPSGHGFRVKPGGQTKVYGRGGPQSSDDEKLTKEEVDALLKYKPEDADFAHIEERDTVEYFQDDLRAGKVSKDDLIDVVDNDEVSHWLDYFYQDSDEFRSAADKIESWLDKK